VVAAYANDYVPDGYSKQEDGLTVTNTKTPSEETTTNNTPKTTSKKTSSSTGVPNTGDGSALPVAILMAAIAASGVALTARRKYERR
jgi:LPXTG-motif cell wall-anchored protein